jgi:hypothetical protein
MNRLLIFKITPESETKQSGIGTAMNNSRNESFGMMLFIVMLPLNSLNLS